MTLSGTTGTWAWLDGSPMSYTDWYPGEPNFSGNKEFCGHIWKMGKWNDVNCDYLQGYVCKKLKF